MTPINIVADENILLLDEFFAGIATVTKVNGRTLSAEQIVGADALVLRSTAKVTPEILTDSKVQFVGTCTIGTDHLATDYMDDQGIAWRNAPGCNAAGVGDYVIACINHAWQVLNIDPRQCTIGVVGAGNVGGRLAQRLCAAGFKVLQCDPPKADAGGCGYVALDDLLGQSQIICMHTPLTTSGPHASQNLLNAQRIKCLSPGTVLISAGRGEVVDQQALLQRQQHAGDLHLYMDVWHQEPNIDDALFDFSHCVTPHIAGHSLEGKMRGTQMIYTSLCEYFNLPATLRLADLMPSASLFEMSVSSSAGPKEILRLACNSVYSLMDDNARMRHGGSFDELRKNYPVRREFSSLTVQGVTDIHVKQMITGLGFNCDL